MYLFAVTIHLIFLVLFAVMDVTFMAAFNVGSLLLYGALLLAPPTNWSAALAAIEVVAHAWAATHHVGWFAGFHSYPLMLMLVPLFISRLDLKARLELVMLIPCGYAGMAITYTNAVPVAPLPQWLLPWLNCGNLLATCVGIAMFVAAYADSIERADRSLKAERERVEVLATTDALTGLKNWRGGEAAVEQAVEQMRPVTVMLADVDHFKSINDRFGHDVGDRILADLATVLTDGVRATDTVVRWGGEEFLVLLWGNRPETAYQAAERIPDKLRGYQHPDTAIQLTLSIGITRLRSGETTAELFKRADEAMLAAKQAGRNRIQDADEAT